MDEIMDEIMNRYSRNFNLEKYSPSDNKYTDAIKKEIEPVQFYANIEFGMPSKKCRNFGICKIDPTRGDSTKDHKKSNALITHYSASKVEIKFFKDKLSDSENKRYFPLKYFIVGGDFNGTYLNKETNELRIINIKKGNYLITKTDTAHNIIFTD